LILKEETNCISMLKISRRSDKVSVYSLKQGRLSLPTSALSKTEVLEFVDRRRQLASAATSLKIKRGLSNLATIATTAPLIGLFGTVVGIYGAFSDMSGSKWAVILMTLQNIREALLATVAGLLVAIPAAWF